MSAQDTIIACPGCGTKNNVNLDKADKNPVCGKCKAPLPIGGPLEVTDADFDQMVMRSNLPVLVDFWAPWCGPCRMVGPIVEQLSHEYTGRIAVAKVNTDENQGIAGKLQIQGIPTLILFKEGKPVERITGAVPKAQLDEAIRKHIMDS